MLIYAKSATLSMTTESNPFLRKADIHVSQSQGKTRGLWRAPESARCLGQDSLLRTFASRLVVPASLQDRTSICCLGLEEPSQMIEFVFSASPETIRRSLGMCSSPSRLSTGPGSLRLDESQYFAFPLWGKVFTLLPCG
jgi:hypothetical protein